MRHREESQDKGKVNQGESGVFMETISSGESTIYYRQDPPIPPKPPVASDSIISLSIPADFKDC